MNCKSLLLVVLSILLMNHVYSQNDKLQARNPHGDDTIDSLSLVEISIIADVPLKRSTPLPVVKLSQNQLRRDNAVSILPSLNRIAGLHIHSGALNTTRITIRGIGNRSLFSTSKIRAYIDDIPIATGIGESSIEDIDMTFIDHINVYKGPSSSVYGSGLGGAIQLVTHSKYSPLSNRIEGTATIGSYGLKRYSSAVSLTNADASSSLSIKYQNTTSDGYRENNNYNRKGLQILGRLNSDSKNSTTILVNYTNVFAFIPSSLNRNDFDSNPRAAAANWSRVKGFEDNERLLIGVNHKSDIIDLGKKYHLSNSSSLFFDYRDAYESRPFNILDDQSASFGGRSTMIISKDPTNDLAVPSLHMTRLSLGVESYNELYSWQTFDTVDGILGNIISNNREKRYYTNLFMQSEFSYANKMTILLGLNYNTTGYDYEDLFTNDNVDLSGTYSFEPIVSPGAGISYKFAKSRFIYANVSHGFSPPSLEETITPDGTINPDIQPEKAWNYEIGSKGLLLGHIDYELSFYHLSVSDLLVARRVSEDQFIGVNAGKTRHNGIEAMLNYKILDGPTKVSFFSSYAFSDHKFIEFVDGENDFSNNRLTGTARHHLNGAIDVNSQFGIYGNLNYKYLSGFPIRDDNSLSSDAYQLVNLRIGYRHLFHSMQIEVSCGIQNVFDATYASMILINASSFGGNAPRYYFPGLPRNYDANLKLIYNL